MFQSAVAAILLAGLARPADTGAVIRRTFVEPWIATIRSKDPEKVKRFFHPKALVQARSGHFLQCRLPSHQAAAVTRTAPRFRLSGQLHYPTQPTYELQVESGDTILIRFLAEANGAWYEVDPCPTEKGMAFFSEQLTQGAERRKRAQQLTAELRDPLRGKIKALIAEAPD
jgi:hypothetical protein